MMAVPTIKIAVSQADATLVQTCTLTAGMQNLPVVKFSFSDEWAGLGKTAVVKAGSVALELLVVNNQITVPYEALEVAGVNLIIGVYGTDASVAIPTVWCACGEILDGTDVNEPSNVGTATATLVDQMIAYAAEIEAVAETLDGLAIRSVEVDDEDAGNYGITDVTVVDSGAGSNRTITFKFDNLKGNGIESITWAALGEYRGRIQITESNGTVTNFDALIDAINYLEELTNRSEAYAIGTINGIPVEDIDPDDPAYQNNSKYYAEMAGDALEGAETAQAAAETAQDKAEDAQTAAETAQAAAESAEATATAAATSASSDAGSAAGSASSAASSATNAADSALAATNARDYAETAQGLAEDARDDAQGYASQASGSATAAGQSATAASDSATSASGSATDASNSASNAGVEALKAEGYATGKQNGTDVSSGEYYHNNAKYYAESIAGDADAAAQSAAAAAESAEEAETAAATFTTDTTLSVSGKAADAKATGDALTAQSAKIGGGDVTLSPSSVKSGYYSRNNSSELLVFAASTSYSTVDPIDISNLKVGSKVKMKASLTSSYGVFIVNSVNVVIEYVNGGNASEKGYTTSSTPQMVTLTVPKGAKYITSDQRSTYVSGASDFAVTGETKTNIDLLTEEAIQTDETVTSIVDSYERKSDFVYPFFEVGGITISTDAENPWTYADFNYYIRTKENYTIHLKPNDVVGLVDYSHGETFSIGWRRKDGTYSRDLARTSNYTVVDEGDYVFVLYHDPLQRYTETYGLANLFFTRRTVETPAIRYKRLDKYPIKGIAHRGYTYENAPENTYPAFRAAKSKGFHYVETDIAFTSDGVPVLLHDSTINRTARNADGTELSSDVNIADITYEQALTYDFGIWKGQEYAETKIMTLEELLIFCRANDVFPYLELKSQAELDVDKLSQLIAMVKKYDMMDSSAFISFSYNHIYTVSKLAPEIKVGRIYDDDFGDTIKSQLLMLKTDVNDVVLILNLAKLNASESEVVSFCETNGIKLAIEMSNSISDMQNANNYVTECTSEHYNFTEVIANREMGVT